MHTYTPPGSLPHLYQPSLSVAPVDIAHGNNVQPSHPPGSAGGRPILAPDLAQLFSKRAKDLSGIGPRSHPGGVGFHLQQAEGAMLGCGPKQVDWLMGGSGRQQKGRVDWEHLDMAGAVAGRG